MASHCPAFCGVRTRSLTEHWTCWVKRLYSSKCKQPGGIHVLQLQNLTAERPHHITLIPDKNRFSHCLTAQLMGCTHQSPACHVSSSLHCVVVCCVVARPYTQHRVLHYASLPCNRCSASKASYMCHVVLQWQHQSPNGT
jgi:hypothetical protein